MSATHATTIDAAGRLVIPKALRDELCIAGGDTVRLTARDGRIEIEPVLTEARIVEVDGVPVITPVTPVSPLTAAEVRAVLEAVRR